MSVLLEFSIFPTDRGESVGEYVSGVIAMIRDSGLDYQLTPMGTIVEGERLEELLGLVQRAHELLEAGGCNRVYAAIKLDIRKGRSGRLKGKLDSVRGRIGEVTT